ncbi:MAG TPA: ABC transporter ATP-binding protein [Pirellulales bacterium]|nr:ABC transporter ATP-binding protein [Pirellulales bacterium]
MRSTCADYRIGQQQFVALEFAFEVPKLLLWVSSRPQLAGRIDTPAPAGCNNPLDRLEIVLLADRSDEISQLPKQWQRDVRRQLDPGENLLAWFEPDLDTRLRYARGLVLVTDRRVLTTVGGEPAESASAVPPHWRSWPLDSVTTFGSVPEAGVGTLELLATGERLAHWHYTLGRAPNADRLVQQFAAFRRSALAGRDRSGDEEENKRCCPDCGADLPVESLDCPFCGTNKTARPTRSLLRLVRFARPHARTVALGFMLTLAGTAAGQVPPYLTMPLVDKVLIPFQTGEQDVSFGHVKWYLAGLFMAAILAWAFNWARTYVLAWVFERISADLRNHTYAHLQRLSLEYFGGQRTGDLMARVSTDTERICNFLSLNLLDFGTDLVMMTMTASILFWINPWLALVTLLPFPMLGWMVLNVRERLRTGFLEAGRVWGDMTSVLADTIPGIRVVKAFAQEQRETDRFRQSNDQVLAANDRVNRVWSFFGPAVTLSTEVGLLVIWAFGAWMISEGRIKVGVLTAFTAYMARFYARLDSMSRMVAAVQRAAASAQRIFEILDQVPSVREPEHPASPGRLEGQIELRHVGFQYGNRPVLSDVNLTIRPGEMIGLVGSSGSGKSTLVNLVCRFYDVNEGAVLVDDQDIRRFALEEYRRHIGIVLQEPFLFYGTIAENIAYGRPDAGTDEIIAAARAARAHEFILRLPDGYDSIVGERGQKLSGGERQRISIARALLIDPKILILDEATSAVDTETEREIQLALDNLIRGRTTIAIAHRLSTLRRADRIVVLEHGKIVEIGQHDDLLEQQGAYARLHRAQLELAGEL